MDTQFNVDHLIEAQVREAEAEIRRLDERNQELQQKKREIDTELAQNTHSVLYRKGMVDSLVQLVEKARGVSGSTTSQEAPIASDTQTPPAMPAGRRSSRRRAQTTTD